MRCKREELERWEARLRSEDGHSCVDPLRLDNKKMAAELSEQRILVERLQSQIREAACKDLKQKV